MAGTIGKSKSISGFDPRSIPGCVLWLDGADNSTITLTSSSVSQWSDKSGYGLHAVASGIASATLPIQGTMNGLNTVRFSASGYTALKTLLILPLTNSFGGGASYFIVGQATSSSASAGGRILTSTSAGREFLVSATPPAYLQAYSGANPASYTASIQASVPFVASIVEGNGTMTSYVNGIANATTSATTALTTTSFIIGSSTVTGYNFDGDIGEILIFQNTLTSLQQQQIEAYFFWKWRVVATAFPTALTPYVWYDASVSGNLGTTAIAGVNGANSSLNSDASGGGGGGYYGGGTGGLGQGGGWPGGGGSSYVGGLTGTVVNTQGGGAAAVTGVSSVGNNGSLSITASGTTTNFSHTGGYQTYTVPGGVTSLTVTASGASGGGSSWSVTSGAGGYISGTLAVTPGQILTIVVGGAGAAPSGINGVVSGGFRGGGSGAGYPTNGWYLGGGGGWSGIINQTQTVAYCIAGGGGGAGSGIAGGAGGGLTGGNAAGQQGGTQSAGGLNASGLRTAGIWSNTSGNLYNWFDSGASARNATQPVVGSIPTWTSSVQNGLGGLLFSGGQCYNLPTLTSLNPISIFVVAKATSFSSGAMILSLTGSPGIYFRSGGGASNPTYTSYGVDYGTSSYRYVPNSAVIDTNTHLWGFVLPATGLGTFTFDGVVGNAANGFTTSQIVTTYSTASIGANAQTPASNPFTGYIFEVIIFNSALSTAQRQLIEGYLNKKWAIYTVKNSIISTNPYYAIQPYSRPFNPLDIDGLQVWMDAADSTTITGSSPVTQWNDKSGNGYNFTASAGPAVASASQNGLNTLTFTAASSQFLSNTATTNFMEFYSLSVFAAFKYSDTTSGGYIFAKSLYGSANGRILLGRDAGTPATLNAGIVTTANAYSTYSDVYTANTWRIYGFVADRSAGTVKAYQNGSNNASASFTVDTSTNLTTTFPMAIGAYNNSSGTLASPQADLYLNGSLGELLVYNSALSFQQRQQVEGYLSQKWNIPLSNTFIKTTTPSTTYGPHPYSTIPAILDGQFSPLNLSGLTTLWLDAADSSTIQFGTGSAVYQWFDKSGNNNHVWQPTVLNQPTYGFDTTYQEYGIQFVNAANTVLIPQNTTKSPVSAVNSYSIFIVARFSDPAISTAQTLLYTNTGTYTEYIQLSSGTLTTTINEVSVTASKTSATASGIYSIIVGSSLSTFINGTSLGSTLRTAPVSHTLNFWIGAQSASAGEMSGTIFEIIVLNCSPSTVLQQKIEGYLANKWVPLLASTHPYYKFPPSASLTYTSPSAPSSFSLSGLSGSGGIISWGAGATAGIGYQWYVGTALGSGIIASGTVSSATLTVNFTASLSVDATYYGWVISYNSMINSPRVYSLGVVYSTSLYAFTSFTFTNCGATGKNGPALSACRSTYATSWVSNTSYFNMTTNGYQLWTAPQTTDYTIICGGAGQLCNGFGYGAMVGASASLTSGTKYQILVGQSGCNATSYSGGAGGSFFASGITPATGVCIAAGGGAGGYYYTNGALAQNGTNSTTGNTSGNGTLGGSSGAGGAAPANYGHSGAGFIGNGSNSVTGYGGGIVSLSFQNGGVGGTDGGNPSVVGGFGGGGGVNWGYGGGGGAGGYSGGGGGQQQFGGGGGSFPSGAILLGKNSGQGFVSVYPFVYNSAPTGGTVSLSSFTGTSVIITIGAATNGLLYNYYITTSGSSIVSPVFTGLSGTAGAISLSLTINPATTYYGAIVPANVQGTGSTVFSQAYNIPGTTTVTLSSLTGSGGTISWTAATNATGYLWYVGTEYGTGTIASGNISGTTTTFSYIMTNSYYYGWVQPYSATASGSIFYSPPVFYTNATGTLYAFSSFVFTNANATFQNGPTLAQCQSAYSGTAFATGGTYLTMTTQGYQLWTVPTTGTYTFVIGGSACGSNSPTYGYGAIIGTTLSLQIGQKLQILVGQMSQTGGGSGSIGGGGGTFVASGLVPSGATCLIAAGGGGGYQIGITWANQNGSYSTSGNAGSDGSAGGTNGNGGAAGQGYAHSGAGFIGNGSNSTQYFYDGQIVALSFKNGGTGGKDGLGYFGGFGGGGAVNAGWYGGGGGGGYSGGGAPGNGSPSGVGGGGGSFPSGATQMGYNQLNGFCYVFYGTFSSVPTGGAISITSFTSTTVSINITAATNAILYDYYITTSGSSIVSPVFMGTTVLTGTLSILVTTTPGSTYYAALTPKNTFGSATTIFTGAYPVPGTSTISITSLSLSSCTLSWTVSTNANSYTWAIGTSTTSTLYTNTTSGTSVTFSGSFSAGTYYYARVIPSSSSVTGVAYHTGGFQISGAATYALIEYIQTYVVPSGKTSISITMAGAGGGGGGYQTGGAGALVTGTLSVTAGTTYYILVGAGGKGSTGPSQSSVRAFGGGGIATPTGVYSGNGGGRSAIQLTLGTDLLDAGGGGGSGYGQGGSGGANGTAGTNLGGGSGGVGGTQSSGGANYTGADGTVYLGGGGGGGYYGGLGGVGGSYGGGGGGGSSLTTASGFTLTAVTTGGGGAAGSYYATGGNGYITIT
jgi:hypothetical protein